MDKRIEYDLAGRHFDSQKELEQTVKSYLANAPRDSEFQSRFLRDIVNTLHREVLQSPHRSTGDFRILTYQEQRRLGLATAEQWRGGIMVQTYFVPLNRWQDVTVYPWKRASIDRQLIDALRAKANTFIPHPSLLDRCEAEGCTDSTGLQYHHVDPEFKDMARQALALISDKEKQGRFGYDKFARGKFSLADFIPDEHPSVRLLKTLHQGNKWMWLCREHHKAR